MKNRNAVLFTLLAFLSCQKDESYRHLYFHLNTYRNDLIETISAQNMYIHAEVYNNEFFMKRYKEQNVIALKIRNSCKTIDLKNRQEILLKRDSINKALSLNLNFAPSNAYQNVEDSIFEKIVDVDFLRLTKRYQDKYMFPPNDM